MDSPKESRLQRNIRDLTAINYLLEHIAAVTGFNVRELQIIDSLFLTGAHFLSSLMSGARKRLILWVRYVMSFMHRLGFNILFFLLHRLFPLLVRSYNGFSQGIPLLIEKQRNIRDI